MTVGAVAFLGGIGFHSVVADDRPSPSTSKIVSPRPESTQPIVGPTRLVAGVPAGFARTGDGAIAAAAAFVTTGQALIDMDPLAAESAVRQMAATATADPQVSAVLEDLRHLREVLRTGFGPITYHQAAMAAHLEGFESTQARVAIWNVGVISRQGIAAPQAAWQVSTFELVWERADWRIEAETIVPGPAPTLDDTTVAASSVQLAANLAGFTPLAAAPPLSDAQR